jgi:hypothetical protein
VLLTTRFMSCSARELIGVRRSDGCSRKALWRTNDENNLDRNM